MYSTKTHPVTSVTIDLTENCNMRCSYPCFHGENAMNSWGEKPRRLNSALGKRILDWFFDDETSGKNPQSFLSIAFWGGEPLLEWDLLCELTEYAEKLSEKTGKKIDLGGTTNVTLLDKEKVDYCKKHNIRFLLSMDGPALSHDIYRRLANGKGSFELIDKNIDYILSAWDYMSARSSPAPNNVQYLASSMKYLYERGFWNLCYSPAYEGEWTERRLNIAQDQLYEIAEWMVQLRKQGKKIKMKHLDDGMNAIINQKWFKPRTPCGAGEKYIGIAVDGSLWGCHRMHKSVPGVDWKDNPYCLGHIDHGGITNFEWRKQFVDYLKLIEKNNAGREMGKPKACGECEYYTKSVCNGGCYATNLDFTGSIFKAPEIECKWIEMQFNASKHLLERMKEEKLPLGDSKVQSKAKSCICYNVFYDQKEVIHIDKKDDFSCLCYNASYNGKKYSEDEISNLKKWELVM